MKIAYLMGGLETNGGIGRVVSIISEKLSLSHDVTVISYTPYNKRNSLYRFNERVRITSLNSQTPMKNYILRGGIEKLKRIIREDQFDCLLACGALFYPLAFFSCKGTKTKCICWEHSNANNAADHGFQMACRWIGAKFSDAVVVLTKQDYRLYKEKYKTKELHQIYNPVDERIRYQYNQDINSKKIISVGRLTYQKNYPLLIHIAQKILTEFPDWSWDVYGEGADRGEIESLIEKSAISGQLVLKGQVNDLYDHYKEYSFYVITSRYEGFGMAMLEANRTGLPIISFDVECGPREIIADGVNGYLVEPLNEEQMYERVKELCENRNKCIEMSRNIRNSENVFDVKKIAEQWNQLFQEVIDVGRGKND